MDDARAVRSRDGEPAFGRELQQRLVARHAGRSGLGKPAGQDQQVADAAVGRLPDRLKDRIGSDHDHREVDRRVDGGDRGHRFVTEDRSAPGIDRHDPSAITGLTEHLHDRATRGGGPFAGAHDGDAVGGEERREVAGGYCHVA